VADNTDNRMPQLLGQLTDVLAHGCNIVAGEWPVRKAEATQVRGKHGVALFGKPRHDQTPFAPVLRKPVEQHHRRPLAPSDVVDAHITVYRCNVVCEGSSEIQLIRRLAAEGAIE